jgi:hypothetical protein
MVEASDKEQYDNCEDGGSEDCCVAVVHLVSPEQIWGLLVPVKKAHWVVNGQA